MRRSLLALLGPLVGIGALVFVPAPSSAQTIALERHMLDFAVASATRAYGCSVEVASDDSAIVQVHEFDLPSGALLRSTALTRRSGSSGVPAVPACSVAPALDLGAVVVAYSGHVISSNRVFVAVLDPADLSFTERAFGTTRQVGTVLRIRRVEDAFVIAYVNIAPRMVFAYFASLPDLASGTEPAIVHPSDVTAGFREVPLANEIYVERVGGTERVVLGRVGNSSPSWELYSDTIDAAGVMVAAARVVGAPRSLATSESGSMRAISPPTLNATTGETSLYALGGWHPFGSDHQLRAWEPTAGDVDLVTGGGVTPPMGAEFAPVMDAIPYRGADWLVANRDPATSRLMIRRFSRDFVAGSPILGPPTEVDVTFCGPTPTTFETDSTWHRNNNFLQLVEMPSGLIAVAYVGCTSPTVDPELRVVVVDPAFPDSDLTVNVSSALTTVAPGEDVTFEVEVRNGGADTDEHARVVASFPSTDCTWTSAAAGGASGGTAGSGDSLDEIVTLTAGGSVTYAVVCPVPQGAVDPLLASATVASPAVEPTPADNEDMHSVPVSPVADLGIVVDGDAGPVAPGGAVAYELSITNDGPTDAVDVTVTIDVSAGLTVASSVGCLEDPSGFPSCTLGALPAGETRRIELEAMALDSASGTLTLTGTVSGADSDPRAENDSDTHDITAGTMASCDAGDCDAGSDADAGVSTDGGHDDASVSADGGTGGSGGSCDCAAAPGRGGASGLALLGLLGLLAVRRRR